MRRPLFTRLSVLCQHDGHDARGLIGVARVFAPGFHRAIEIDPMKRTGHESWPAEWSQR